MRIWLTAGMIVTAINIIGMPVAYALGLRHGRRRRRGQG